MHAIRVRGIGMPAWVAAGIACMAAEWPTFHGDYALSGRAAPDLPAGLQRVWRYDAGLPLDYAPVAAGGRIHAVAGDNVVLALDGDGRELWRVALDLSAPGRRRTAIAAAPVVAEGLLFVAAEHGLVVALEAADGRERWRADLGAAIMAAPNWSVDGGGTGRAVVVTAAEGVVHALDTATGEVVWQSQKLDRCDSPPACAEGWIVVGSCAAAVHILAADTGEERHRVVLGPDCQVAGGAALDDGLAFSGNRSGTLVCADLETGKLLWQTDALPAEVFAAPAVAGRRILFAAEDGTVAAADRESGTLLWSRKLSRGPATVMVAGRQAVVNASGTLHFLSVEDGSNIRTLHVSDRITGPAWSGNTLIVGTDEGALIAFGAPGE